MASRLAGRLLTSPVAFLAAGLADLGVYWATVLGRAIRARRPTALLRRRGSGS